ncbi:MAG TPA: NAD(P)/FAD-dependent oxidoreductase [Candidatus Saccharimonadales bacterium]|nr:NAD(P)/FAD-dependent oxidoreductase [Candidatus Saccharimonadales bacterium]
METIKISSTKEGTNNLIDEKREKESNTSIHDQIFDVAIIGGGYAGLSAALLLGRYLRPTIIFDVLKHKKSRLHGYLGFEKSQIEEVMQKSTNDVLQYRSVKRVEERVENVQKDYNNNIFLITTSAKNNETDDNLSKDNTIKRKAKAKYLIIATGVIHVKPNIKNFEEFLGNGVWHCPHCDGFETTNKKLVIIASDNKNNQALKYAKIFLGWTKDITLFFQHSKEGNDDDSGNTIQGPRGGDHLTDEQKSEAMDLGINVIENDDIAEIVSDPKTNKMKGILSKRNKFYEAEVLFYHLGQIIQNDIASQLGCELDEGYVKVDKKQQTTVSNVYAAGDLDTDRHYAILASASGALAAISIYEDLLKEAISTTKEETK